MKEYIKNFIPENGLKMLNMKYINLFSGKPKKIKNNNDSLNNSNLLLNNNKVNSFQLNNDISNNDNLKKDEIKEIEDIKKHQKYFLKKGIPIKYFSESKSNSQFGSFIGNTQNKKSFMSLSRTSFINSEKSPKIEKIDSPNSSSLNIRKKRQWDQFGILNLSKRKFKKKKINLNFMNNASIKETIKYNKKIKGINSSFSPKSTLYYEQKLKKNKSAKNILFNESLFSNSNFLDSPKSYKSNILFKKRNKSSIKTIKFNKITIPQKKIYQLVVDQGLRKIEKFEDLSDELINKNIKSIKNLEIDNLKLFNNKFYCIIESKKFKKEYQNPFSSPFENKVYEIKKQNPKQNKKYINEEVFSSNNKLIKDITIELNRNIYKKNHFLYENKESKNNNYNSNNKKNLLEKFKEIIIKLSKYLKQLSVNVSEIINNYKFIKICLTYSQTRDLISAIKSKDISKCNEILDSYKFIVLDYDYYYLTPLHWAAKRNLYQIIPKLIGYGSNLNFQNFIGDTALHIGVKNNNYECVSLLLFNLASPFLKDKDGKKPIELTKDFQMKILLEKYINLYYLSLFKKNSVQFELIQKQFTFFIVDEFSRQLDKKILLYFKQRKSKYRKKYI